MDIFSTYLNFDKKSLFAYLKTIYKNVHILPQFYIYFTLELCNLSGPMNQKKKSVPNEHTVNIETSIMFHTNHTIWSYP